MRRQGIDRRFECLAIIAVSAVGGACAPTVEVEPSRLDFEWKAPTATVHYPRIVLPLDSVLISSQAKIDGELRAEERFWVVLDIVNDYEPLSDAPNLRIYATAGDARRSAENGNPSLGWLGDHRGQAAGQYTVDCRPFPGAGKFQLEVRESTGARRLVGKLEVTVQPATAPTGKGVEKTGTGKLY